jgi:hypothetical protein
MTDDGAASRPGREPPFRPRGAYVGHEVFGLGDGAVLVEPEVARDLRSAAESASLERRIAGGLLYGRVLADEEGKYLVVDGFLETGPGETRGDRIARDGRDTFTLSDADLRLLREDAARMYSAALEVGWWRTLPGPGEFGPVDFATQRQLVLPGGVGLLVFGSGLDWGRAYLGTDGQVPGSVRSFIPVSRPSPDAPYAPTRELGVVSGTAADTVAGTGPEPVESGDLEPGPDAEPDPDPDPEQAPEPVAAAPGMSLVPRATSPAPRPTGPRVISPVRKPVTEWGIKDAYPHYVGPRTPTDVKIVVGALVVVAIVAATIIGVLVSNVLVAVIVGVVCLLAITVFLWMSRL